MNNFIFPFPSKELAVKELEYDACYNKIPSDKHKIIVEQAWDIGKDAANKIFSMYTGECNFFKIAEKSNLKCIKIDKDYIIGNIRYFSDYISGQGIINLYTKSIALWAEENQLNQSDAENLILSHEYFHFLEWTKLGLTSKIYQVPMIDLGFLKIGKTGISALSEIGAHAFAYEYNSLLKKRRETNET